MARPGNARAVASGDATPAISLYAREPLMRLLVRAGLTPATLGLAFFIVVSLPLSAAGYAQCNVIDLHDGFHSFFENISWSLSILYLFPFVVALTLKFYDAVPGLFHHLLRDGAAQPIAPAEAAAFTRWLNARFDNAVAFAVILLVTVALNAVYIEQTVATPAADWITAAGCARAGAAAPARGLTATGGYAMAVQIVLSYWILHLLWRGVVLGWGLHELFNRRGFAIAVVPLHPDRCCGLKQVGDTVMLLNTIIFLLGIYASLKVVDKVLIQNAPLFSDIGNPVILGGYLIVAPLLFLFPLAAPRRTMLTAKQRFIEPVARQSRQIFESLGAADADAAAAAQRYTELRGVLAQVRRDVPVWPFDFRSLQAFFATIVVPVVPVVLPILLDWLH